MCTVCQFTLVKGVLGFVEAVGAIPVSCPECESGESQMSVLGCLHKQSGLPQSKTKCYPEGMPRGTWWRCCGVCAQQYSAGATVSAQMLNQGAGTPCYDVQSIRQVLWSCTPVHSHSLASGRELHQVGETHTLSVVGTWRCIGVGIPCMCTLTTYAW